MYGWDVAIQRNICAVDHCIRCHFDGSRKKRSEYEKKLASPAFIGYTLMGSVAGPILSGLVSAVYDMLSFFFLSQGQPFIIWFTLIEALQGILYGYFFYGKELRFERKKDWLWVTLATVAVMGVGTFTLTPLALHLQYGVPFVALYATRAWSVFEIPLRVFVTMLIVPQLQRIPELRKLMGLNNK